MTAGGYKESYCEGYVDQQSGSSSVISAGNNLQINAGSLTNIGSLIAAGNTATIAVAGPVVNEAQVLNAYWHSHWVQETGMFSSDKRHDVWACGTPEQCKALYGSAYTSTGGTIDPPTPVGNIAATIQAPNLSISSGGQIQNVGNVIGTYVSLTGQKLINGITTANTYTPRVNAPSQVISLSPVDLPGLNLSVPRAVGTGKLPTPVAGAASYVDASLGGSVLGSLGPQDLLNNLPSALQPSSTLFYYNPQEEDLLLQQAALKQTGKSSFVDGLTYDNEKNLSVTAQEKMYLYQNAVDYSKAHDLQLGAALTQEQINTLDKPMLWYVEQTVPDPTCHATGAATCPTITALMPQVYLPQDTQALSAGGNISGHDVTLKFNQDGNGSILNTGSITASGTLSVDTHTLTNQANQVDVGEIWQKVDGGYLKTTGTVVQPGGFMSAANMELNVQALNQIGGALQKLNADGTVDVASTQAMLASLQHQLGGGFTQETVADHLHSDFVQQGGFGPEQLFSMAAAVALSAMGMPVVGAMVSSALNQAFSDQGFSLGEVLKAGVVADLTQGLMAGLNLNALPMQTIGNNIASNAITSEQLLQGAFEIAGRGLVSATVNTVAYGGSFGTALKGSVVSDLAAIAASAIGQFDQLHLFGDGDLGKVGYVTAHAALGCAASAASGTGCAGGAIGGAVSAITANSIATAVTGGQGIIDQGQLAAIVTATSLLGGAAAGLLGQNALAAMTAAQNETLNNTCAPGHNCGTLTSAVKDTGRAAWNTAVGTVEAIPNVANGALPGYPDYVPFLNGAMLPYDDPDFGSLVSLVGSIGVASIIGGGSSTLTRSAVSQADIDALAANGVKFTPENVIATGTTPSGQIVFLETGNSKAGLQHIIEGHASDFANIGVSEAKIPSVVMQAVKDGNIVGYQGSGTGRPIYQTTINGQPQRIAVTIGSNGFIVGANPAGRGK